MHKKIADTTSSSQRNKWTSYFQVFFPLDFNPSNKGLQPSTSNLLNKKKSLNLYLNMYFKTARAQAEKVLKYRRAE